jgi:hypothetical protein
MELLCGPSRRPAALIRGSPDAGKPPRVTLSIPRKPITSISPESLFPLASNHGYEPSEHDPALTEFPSASHIYSSNCAFDIPTQAACESALPVTRKYTPPAFAANRASIVNGADVSAESGPSLDDTVALLFIAFRGTPRGVPLHSDELTKSLCHLGSQPLP